jgi:hypothetical protein
MIQKSYFPFVLMGVVLLLALSACGSPEAPAPTLDMNTVFTQVGATLEMGYTQTALAMPTATNTPEPTATTDHHDTHSDHYPHLRRVGFSLHKSGDSQWLL